MEPYFSRREACLAAIGTFVGTLSLGRSSPARQDGTAGTEVIATRPPAGARYLSDRGACLSYPFDSRGRLTSVVAAVDPSGQCSVVF